MITVDQLRTVARFSRSPPYTSLSSAKAARSRTAFLCHSHKDEDLAKGLASLLWEKGWQVYIDWLDTSMPSSPNRLTANKIQDKIVESDFFLFLATANSLGSRWCPWELGYADGKKSLERILVVPTKEGTTTHGSEYMSLYRHIDQNSFGDLVVRVAPGSYGTDLNLRTL